MKGTILLIAYPVFASVLLHAQEEPTADLGTGLLYDAGAFKREVEMTSGAGIIIPGNDRVLKREKLLDDHTVVLYSDRKIEDFQKRVVRMRDERQGTFMARLQEVFGDLLLPSESVFYEKDTMRTRAEELDGRRAVAVVVKVEND